jgi:hypothetical protein
MAYNAELGVNENSTPQGPAVSPGIASVWAAKPPTGTIP